MKRLISTTSVMLLIATLFSCAAPTAVPPTATPTMDLVQPGEKVGDMQLTSGQHEGVSGFTEFCNPFGEPNQGAVVRKCNIPALERLHIGWGWFAPTMEELNSDWQQITWELYLDGQLVNLPAFGTYDIDANIGGPQKMRMWDVVLEKPMPGEHKLHYIIASQNPDYQTDVTWEFTISK